MSNLNKNQFVRDEINYYFDEGDYEEQADFINKNDLASNYDEKEEYLAEINELVNKEQLKTRNYDDKSTDSLADLDRSSPKIEDIIFTTITNKKVNHQRNKSETSIGKNKFIYTLNENNIDYNIDQTTDLDLLPRDYFDERHIYQLKNVNCLYSFNSCYGKKSFKEIHPSSISLNGRLLLTTFRLRFIPNQDQFDEEINPDTLFYTEKKLQLFNNMNKNKFIIDIPLAYIHEIRACSASSEKYKKLKTVLETNSPIRDIQIKCKNFLTKCFSLNETSYDNILFMIQSIYFQINNLVNNRFKYLINRLNSRKNSDEQMKNNAENNLNLDSNSNDSKRISYLTPNDLQQELIDCDVINYMQVKSGYAEIIPNNFIVDTHMPFFAVPNNVRDFLMRKRVVVNETNVQEFSVMNENSSQVSNSSKKINRLASFLGNSPRSTKSLNQSSNLNSQFQKPLLAQNSTSNPFFSNRFPIWSYTDPNTCCSLIVIPEPSPNRLEDCDTLIKNYNCLISDEAFKLKNQFRHNITISNLSYTDYEFLKLKVPLTKSKIEISYLKLMNLCSHKTTSDYCNETDPFYSVLNNTKWLRNISDILALTSKIVNNIANLQRNVFLEESRDQIDCSCIITSLVKICLNQKYRTIIGLENLIQKDWFLTGHNFRKRLHMNTLRNEYQSDAYERRRVSLDSVATNVTAQVDNSSNSQKKEISPVFLVFLDCLFQLLIQYPSEFEFNEYYLINLWDYSLSGLSFAFSFNGVIDWLEYLNNETFLINSAGQANTLVSSYSKNNSPKFENNYLRDIFDENNKFWIEHLEKRNQLFINKYYQINNKKLAILIPCERIYLIKFWSRCYLRWVEKYHSYNSFDLNYGQNDQQQQIQKPPPVPPKPKQLIKPTDSNNSANSQNSQTETVSTNLHGTVLVTTRITSDGIIESYF